MELLLFDVRLLVAFLTAVMISFFAMPAIIRVATLKQLTDVPDGDRKLHEGIVPTLGGIGIFSAFVISFSVWGRAASIPSYPFLVASLFMIFLIGIKDDILVISPVKKLGIQLIAAVELVIGGELYLTNLGGLFGIHQISPIAGILLTTAVIIILINSYNLIDGIDGLAGGVGVVSGGIFGTWFMLTGFETMAILCFVLAGALLGFLYYNYSPAKIFMGDTGAMAVGLILAYILIQFITLNQTIPGSAYHFNNGAPFAVAILIIPIIDTLRVFTIRTWNGKNPLMPDYNHIHHQCVKEGIDHKSSSIFLWCCNLWIVIIAYSFDFLSPTVLLFMILMAGLSIVPVLKTGRLFLDKFSEENYWKETFPIFKNRKI